MKGLQASVLAAMVVLATSWAPAGYLESDYEQDGGKRPPVATPIAPRPIPPPHENEVIALVDRLTVHNPIYYKGLSVFPLIVRHDRPLPGVETLAAAMGAGRLTIDELVPPVVERARFVNNGDLHIFAMAGEVIRGGRQNRTVRRDLLVPPHTSLVVDLRCVEKGRWAGNEGRFRGLAGLAPNAVRQSAQAGRGQDEVWARIARRQRALRIDSKTEDLTALYGHERIAKGLSEARGYIVPRCPGRCIGMVIAQRGHIVGAEVFGDASLFRALRDRVLDSYAVEIVFRPEFGKASRRMKIIPWPRPTVEDARRFLHRVGRANFGLGEPGGAGRLVTLSGAVDGRALVWRGRAVHLALSEWARVLRPTGGIRRAP